MNSEQLETVLNSESVDVPVVATADAIPAQQEATGSKRIYTKKEDMTRGNEAILATLPTSEEGALSKAQILTALTGEDRPLVEHNWNLRISLLEATEQVLTFGKKVAKRYYKSASL